MIKTLSKLKILKFILMGGASAAYAFKRYCDQKNELKSKSYKIKNIKFQVSLINWLKNVNYISIYK